MSEEDRARLDVLAAHMRLYTAQTRLMVAQMRRAMDALDRTAMSFADAAYEAERTAALFTGAVPPSHEVFNAGRPSAPPAK